MASFRREWGGLLVNPLSWVGGMTMVVRVLGSGVIASGLTAAAGVFGDVPGWVLPLVAFAAFYLSLTAGMAWERASRPSVQVGPLTLDERFTTFFVPIENDGTVPVRPSVSITSVTDSLGRRLGSPPWKSHWRDRPQSFVMDLEEGVPAEAGLLGIGHYPSSKNPALCIFDSELRLLAVTSDLPLSEQETVVLKAVVNCETRTGERGSPVRRTFSVAPDPGSRVGYKVVTAPSARGGRWSA